MTPDIRFDNNRGVWVDEEGNTYDTWDHARLGMANEPETMSEKANDARFAELAKGSGIRRSPNRLMGDGDIGDKTVVTEPMGYAMVDGRPRMTDKTRDAVMATVVPEIETRIGRATNDVMLSLIDRAVGPRIAEVVNKRWDEDAPKFIEAVQKLSEAEMELVRSTAAEVAVARSHSTSREVRELRAHVQQLEKALETACQRLGDLDMRVTEDMVERHTGPRRMSDRDGSVGATDHDVVPSISIDPADKGVLPDGVMEHEARFEGEYTTDVHDTYPGARKQSSKIEHDAVETMLRLLIQNEQRGAVVERAIGMIATHLMPHLVVKEGGDGNEPPAGTN